MKTRLCLLIAGICVFGIAGVAPNRAFAANVSRGREILLDRGLQIQAVAAWNAPPTPAQVSQWVNSNFTTVNFWGRNTQSVANLQVLPSGTRWATNYAPTWSETTRYLTTAEQAYVNDLVSYQYLDEPNVADPAVLNEVAAGFADWKSRYPNTIVHTDFYSYRDCGGNVNGLASYTQAAKPDLLMFNFYPEFNFGSESRKTWYSLMQGYRTTALAGYTTDTGANSGPLLYGWFLNLFRDSWNAPLPSESFVRMQQSTSLAFGSTFLGGYVFSGAPYPVLLDKNDQTTVAYDYVKEANRQSRNLGPALVRMVSTDVRMIPATTGRHRSGGHYVYDDMAMPDGIAPWAPDAGGNNFITAITPQGKPGSSTPWIHSDVLIGYFEPLLTGDQTYAGGQHFMIVNGAVGDGTAYDLREQYRIDFDFANSPYDSLLQLSRNTGQLDLLLLTHRNGGASSQYYLDLTLDGGTGELYRFWNSGWAIPEVPEPDTLTLLTLGTVTGWILRRRRT